MNSLVTGGAGFIGSHLVRALLQRGDRVRVLDNFSTGRRENLAGVAGELEVLEGDLRDQASVAAAVQGVDVIFHEAAFVSVPQSMGEPQTCFDVNVQGTLNLFDAARAAGVGRVVIASSAAVYGESQDLPLREETVLRPQSPYAASKLADEIYAGVYTRAFGLPIAALRYFNVFGPRQSPTSAYAAAIPIFIRRLLDRRAPTVYGDGLQLRDFVYVGDIVRANLAASISPNAPGEVFNVCTGQAISLLDLLREMYAIIPSAPQPEFAAPRAGDIYRSLGSPARAARLLEFQPETTLAAGLAETISWMSEER